MGLQQVNLDVCVTDTSMYSTKYEYWPLTAPSKFWLYHCDQIPGVGVFTRKRFSTAACWLLWGFSILSLGYKFILMPPCIFRIYHGKVSCNISHALIILLRVPYPISPLFWHQPCWSSFGLTEQSPLRLKINTLQHKLAFDSTITEVLVLLWFTKASGRGRWAAYWQLNYSRIHRHPKRTNTAALNILDLYNGRDLSSDNHLAQRQPFSRGGVWTWRYKIKLNSYCLNSEIHVF